MGGEPVVTSGPDKFLGTDLDEILKEKGGHDADCRRHGRARCRQPYEQWDRVEGLYRDRSGGRHIGRQRLFRAVHCVASRGRCATVGPRATLTEMIWSSFTSHIVPTRDRLTTRLRTYRCLTRVSV